MLTSLLVIRSVNMSAIKIENIKKEYKLKKQSIFALDNISYDFEYGKMYAIMGHSGSGKTTLIQCLGTLDNVTEGKVFIENEDVFKMSPAKRNTIRNSKIGFIFQNYYLNNTMRAYENVMLPMLINKKFKKSNIKDIAIDTLKDLGLSERITHYPKELSGGEQQRVAIARAIVNNPKIILADEPVANLDEENEKFVLQKLKEMAQNGKCVIVVSHNPEIKKYADVIIDMKRGKFLDNEI